MRSQAAKRKRGGAAVLEPPRPWWGDGEAPHVRWPGVTIAIPCEWHEGRGRWESPDGRYYFDDEAASLAAGFFPACLRHYIGSEWDGKAFELMPYQSYIMRAVFGWKRAADGLRRFRKLFLAVPKGSGKSAFASGLGLYLAFFDGEAGAEVYAVAADRQQARIVFDAAKVFLERNETLAERFEILRDSIKAVGSTEYFQVLSSDVATKHGFRPHGIVFDEFHAQMHRDLFEVLYRGMGKRGQPLLVMITTAGDNDESICFEEWDYARRVIAGSVRDDTYLPMVFELRPDEDWFDLEALKRVNPGYGITMKEDYFLTEIAAAQAEPRKRNSFIQLHGNRWVNQATSWLPIEWWDACDAPVPSDDELRGYACAAGLDLAQKYDLACLSVVFRVPATTAVQADVVGGDEATGVSKWSVDLNYRVVVVPFFWIPEETMRQREREDQVPYGEWARQGLVTPTEGAIIDYARIYRDITTTILPRFPKLKQGVVGYDPAFATDIASALRDRGGLRVEEILQNYKYLSEPSYVFEALVKAGMVAHGGHRVLRNHIEHVAVKQDDAGRIRPVKPRKAGKHIDGVVATLMGLRSLLKVPDSRPRYGGFVV